VSNLKVLDKGFVKLVDVWGNELKIAKIAGISFNNEDPDVEKVIKQIIKHPCFGTPFEHAGMSIRVKAPIFVLRQWMRQRHLSYNEQSGRYTKLAQEFYLPEEDEDIKITYQQSYNKAFDTYKTLLEKGVKKEKARAVLPVATYSEVFISGNLRAWLHFIKLRKDPHAQWEIRQYAKVIYTLIREYFPETIKAYEVMKDDIR